MNVIQKKKLKKKRIENQKKWPKLKLTMEIDRWVGVSEEENVENLTNVRDIIIFFKVKLFAINCFNPF